MRSLKNRQYTLPSGIRNCWMLWRHCCCRYGFYPLAVAPIVTIGCLLSIYSSLGCQYMNAEVGFTPSNRAWNSSNAELGLFYRYDKGYPIKGNKYEEFFHEGCVPYSSQFEEDFIEPDRTWTVARIMAWIAAGSACVASLVSWIIVFTPAPANCLWPGILLPSVVTAFISEGSKFLFFDIAICRSAIWFPSGVDSPPASVESCSLGPSAFVGIAAGSVQLVVLLMVCLKAPEKRDLDPDFGVEYRTGAEMDLEEATDREFEAFDPQTSTFKPEDFQSPYDDESVEAPYEQTGPVVETETPTNEQVVEDPVKPEPAVAASSSHDGYVSESRLSTMSKVERNAASEAGEGDNLVAKLVSDLDTCFNPPSQTASAGMEERNA